MSDIDTSFTDSGAGATVPPMSIREGLPPDVPDACRCALQWLAHAFEQAWPIGSGACALVLLQAAQGIVDLHGGRAHATAVGAGGMLSLVLPEARQEAAASRGDEINR